MIDLHNHLLPGIDDGAPDLETAVALARIAIDDGITHSVCTPHIHAGRYDNTPQRIRVALQGLREALAEEQIPLQLSYAAEVRIGPELLAALRQNALPFLGRWDGQDVLLLELPHSHVPVGSDNLTRWFRTQNILPMIAHPERNKGIMERPSRLRPFLEQGCLVQITAGSVSGHFGPRAQALAEDLLSQGQVTIMASDAHNLNHRPPILTEGRDAAARLVGDAAADRLVLDNPWRIAQGHFESLDSIHG